MNGDPGKQGVIFGRLLYFFAIYTVVIKYGLPVLAALRDGESLTRYIYFWDAWWVAHLIVGRGFKRRWSGIWRWAMLLSVAEIVIITVKFSGFFLRPVWDFWHVSWFWNKFFLLIYFIIFTFWLLQSATRRFYARASGKKA